MNETKNKSIKLLRTDLIFGFLFFVLNLWLGKFLGFSVDPETFEPSLFRYSALFYGLMFLIFAGIDISLILEKKIPRSFRILAGILVFVFIFGEVLYQSKWIRILWENVLQGGESDEPAFERMRTELRFIFSSILLSFAILKTLLRTVWNFFWVKGILSFD
ncbi:hypothetical protein [Leptospira kmetyi]|uniref:hypothetical protein n=1 Tax=Leptospira kmetyi TaxID=408139 RepID=UPI001083A32B|nr:hypothetical protein [Leptospira kmetyi]TGK21718.1 hypothetical protein EHO62_04730 [Leptospira kmetyi]TGK28645.1 hypothetical protein EHO66_14210 [Leptospira kmetyi]